MEKGHFRCDANVSLRPPRRDAARHAHRAQEPELLPLRRDGARAPRSRRQAAVLEGGGRVAAGDHGASTRRPRRTRGAAPQGERRRLPLLPGSRPDAARSSPRSRSSGCAPSLPELAEQQCARFQREYGLSAYDARLLTASRALADFFEAAARGARNARRRSPTGCCATARDADGSRARDRATAAHARGARRADARWSSRASPRARSARELLPELVARRRRSRGAGARARPRGGLRRGRARGRRRRRDRRERGERRSAIAAARRRS